MTTQIPIPRPHERRADLDIVRGIAILLAMGWHINTLTGYGWLNLFLYPGHSIGWAGVDIFFVLSGFLVGGMILRELQQTGRFDLSRFYSRRICRLWPTLYAFIIVMMVLGGMSWSDGSKIAIHAQNYFSPKMAHHLWSLAVEEHFYLLFGLFLPLFPLSRLGGRVLTWALLAIMVASIPLRLLAGTSGASVVEVQTQTQYRLDGLACGVLLAHFALSKPHAFSALCRRKTLLTMAASICLTSVVLLGKVSLAGQTLGLTMSYSLGACLLLLAYQSGVELRLKRLTRIFVFLGQNAYTLYLFHVPTRGIVDRIVAPRLPAGSRDISDIVLSYSLSVVIAWLISKSVERPFMRIRDRLWPPPQTCNRHDTSSHLIPIVREVPNPD